MRVASSRLRPRVAARKRMAGVGQKGREGREGRDGREGREGRGGGVSLFVPNLYHVLPGVPDVGNGSFDVRNAGRTTIWVAFYRNTDSRLASPASYDPRTGARMDWAGCRGNFCAISRAIRLDPGAPPTRLTFERSFGDTWLIWHHAPAFSGETSLQRTLTPAQFANIPASRKRKITGLTFNTITIA